MGVMDIYLLLGLLANVAFVGLVDWLGYHHLVHHGYHPSLVVLALLNIAIGIGIYYLVIRTLQQRLARRRVARELARQRS